MHSSQNELAYSRRPCQHFFRHQTSYIKRGKPDKFRTNRTKRQDFSISTTEAAEILRKGRGTQYLNSSLFFPSFFIFFKMFVDYTDILF